MRGEGIKLSERMNKKKAYYLFSGQPDQFTVNIFFTCFLCLFYLFQPVFKSKMLLLCRYPYCHDFSSRNPSSTFTNKHNVGDLTKKFSTNNSKSDIDISSEIFSAAKYELKSIARGIRNIYSLLMEKS